jgi:pimeloyl-ACP methyl ester carboxylesterase
MADPAGAFWHELLTRYPPEVRDTEGGGVSLRCAGSGPDVVLLHGIGSGSGSWVHQLDGLADRYSVTAWDAPGYGDSDPVASDAPDADDYAARLAALVDALMLDRFLLVGHSLGALIGARFAARYPGRLRGLILADPAAGHARLSEDDRRARLEARVKPFEELGAERYAAERATNLLAPGSPAENLALVRWNMEQVTPAGLYSAARLLSGGDLLSDVASYDGAAIVLCGAEDTVTLPADCRAVADAFPGGRPFYEIAQAGHASYIDAPTEFNRHVAEFEQSLA